MKLAVLAFFHQKIQLSITIRSSNLFQGIFRAISGNLSISVHPWVYLTHSGILKIAILSK